MEFVQAISAGNQILTSAGMSVSGLVSDFATVRELVYRVLMAGGFVIQQRRGIGLVLSMILDAIFRVTDFYKENEKAMSDAILQMIENMRLVSNRMVTKAHARLDSGISEWSRVMSETNGESCSIRAGHGQSPATIQAQVTDSFKPNFWSR